MSSETEPIDPVDAIDVVQLRRQVREKYLEVAHRPAQEYHFFTGRLAAEHVGYPAEVLDGVDERTVEAFAGVANPFHWGLPGRGETVVDVGSGGGFDAILAAQAVGAEGRVIGIDMTPEMLDRAAAAAAALGLTNVEFREGLAEELPVPDESVDVVISNGVLNLVPDKGDAYGEIFRVLKPHGRFQIADIGVDRPVPEGVQRDIDLWAG